MTVGLLNFGIHESKPSILTDLKWIVCLFRIIALSIITYKVDSVEWKAGVIQRLYLKREEMKSRGNGMMSVGVKRFTRCPDKHSSLPRRFLRLRLVASHRLRVKVGRTISV